MYKKQFFYLISLFLLLNISTYAHVDLTYPEGGETFYSGDTVTITWVQVQAHDIQNWELYYSPDGGDTWEEISINIAISLREYIWVVPDEETTMGRIRVVQNNSDTDYQDVSTNIKIVRITGINEFDNNSLSVNSITNYPNPFLKSTTLSFTLVEKEQVSLTLFQPNGAKLASLIQKEMPKGDHQIEWLPYHSSSGIHFAVLKVGNRTKTIKLHYLGP